VVIAVTRRTNCFTVQVHPRTSQEGPKGYSSTLSLTSGLDMGGLSTPRPGLFTPGEETRYPLCRRLGGPQGRSGRVREISPPHRDSISRPNVSQRSANSVLILISPSETYIARSAHQNNGLLNGLVVKDRYDTTTAQLCTQPL
jgi:hypothetical protein